MTAPLLKGRKALVTGAARGLGRVLARRLADEGAAVVLTDLDAAAGNEAASQIGGDAFFIQADLRDKQALKSLAEQAADLLGGLDLLINNARPALPLKPFPECMEEWDLAMDVLLTAPARLTGCALPYLERSKQASVINMSSTNATLVSHQPTGYHAAKAGLLHLTRQLAVELGPKGVRVNAVSPGLIDMRDRKPLTADPVNRGLVETLVPLGRAGAAEEIADLCVFLASDKGAYLTGQNFTIDGGENLLDPFHVGHMTLKAADRIREGKS